MTPVATANNPRVLPETVALIVDRLREALHPEAIWLFGSHARGDAVADSDVDLLIVVNDSPLSRYHRGVEARRVVGDIATPKDIVVLTQREWQQGLGVTCSLPSTVRREGLQLHGRG